MTKYERKKMIEKIILTGRPGCIKCGREVNDGYTNVEDFMDSVETPRINPLLPRSAKNCNLVHVNCARVLLSEDIENTIERLVGILSKGLIFQRCYVCKLDITGLAMESPDKLTIHRIGKNEYIIHLECKKG